jgi:hypothetical protein
MSIQQPRWHQGPLCRLPHMHICEAINVTLTGLCLMTHQKAPGTSKRRLALKASNRSCSSLGPAGIGGGLAG